MSLSNIHVNIVQLTKEKRCFGVARAQKDVNTTSVLFLLNVILEDLQK